MANASVTAFREYLKAHGEKTAEIMQAALLEQGRRLADAIADAAPQGQSGDLKKSVQVHFGGVSTTNLRTGGKATFTDANFAKVVVTAGGALTTRPVRHGQAATYDYALGTEFGNLHEHSRPFFYPTFNSRKADIERALAQAFGESKNAWDAGYGPVVTSGR